MKSGYYISLLILWLLPVNSMAQSYTFKHLGVEDGLSNNYVQDIVQDGQGFIWIATESGLSRFDGKNFTVFKEFTSGLISNSLNALLYNEEDNTLWIGSKDGLSILDCSTLQFGNHIRKDSVLLRNIVHLCHAADSGIWLTNHNGGITYYNKRNKQFSPYFDPAIKEVQSSHWCAFDDGKGNLYIGHAQNGLSIINLKTKAVKNYRHDPQDPKSIPGNDIYSICIDRLQNIWIGTNQGLALFHPQTEDFLIFRHTPSDPYSLIADHIYCIKEMDDGLLWIATDIGGISILDLNNISFMNPKEVRFVNISPSGDNHSTSSTNTRSLLQDSYGNIWIGNYGSGVDFFSHSKPTFEILPYMEKGSALKNKPVWGICPDDKQQVWLGGENEITVFKDNRLVKSIPITDYINRPFAQVFAIARDRQGLFWLGIYDDGLLTYHEETNRFQRIKLDMDNMDVITFYEDPDGKMWIGTEYGLYSCLQGRITKEEKIIKQLGDRSVYGILRDPQQKLWIGTYGSGIFIFDKEDNLQATLSVKKGFCSNSISHLFLDSKGGIWAATRNGIGYIQDAGHPEKFELYGYKQGLTDTYVRAIHEDQSGNIWISTNDGISLWNKDNNQFDNYDFRDGIPTGNFIEGSACSTPDGTMYFGSLNGVCFFDPKNLVAEQQVAPVQIIECTGFNKLTESRNEEYRIPFTGKSIHLPYNRNTFRISFAVPDYSQSSKTEYAYMVEGLDNIWIHTQGENQVTLRSLPSGKYTFKVKSRLKNQDWDEQHITSLDVSVHPPLWFTRYAKLFYLLILCAGGFQLMRSYKNRLNLKTSLEMERKSSRNREELNDERLRFYTNITHELRTPLTLILGPLEDLVHAPDMPVPHKKKINTIHGSAIRLLNLINQILEFRKTETQNRRLTVSKNDLALLVKETGLRYKELNQNPKIDFIIRIDTNETVLYFDADIVTTLLNNLLSNAVKYTPEGQIRLILRSVTEDEIHYTEIEISDTGYGIDSQTLPHIFDRYYQVKNKHQASGTGIGLAIVKSLADLHEGMLHVESTVNKGSSFIFRLLTENTYPNALHSEDKVKAVQQELPVSDLQQEDDDTQPLILVIEDNNDIREYIAESLSPHYLIHTAINGKDGLELAQKNIPNLIVSDIMMPEMDGLELCRIIKEDIRTCHIPVILLTAKDSIQDKEEGYESGADSYLTKPFSAKLLLSRIHNMLESRKRLAELIVFQSRGVKPKATNKLQDDIKVSRLDEEFLKKITMLVEENPDMEKMNISFLIQKMNMSHSTFYRKIKGLTGISANEFIRKVKLKNSVRLLSTGSLNVSETAYMTGFNDVAYFRQCFKDEYGMPPSEYIKMIQESLNSGIATDFDPVQHLDNLKAARNIL